MRKKSNVTKKEETRVSVHQGGNCAIRAFLSSRGEPRRDVVHNKREKTNVNVLGPRTRLQAPPHGPRYGRESEAPMPSECSLWAIETSSLLRSLACASLFSSWGADLTRRNPRHENWPKSVGTPSRPPHGTATSLRHQCPHSGQSNSAASEP